MLKLSSKLSLKTYTLQGMLGGWLGDQALYAHIVYLFKYVHDRVDVMSYT